MVRTEEGRFPAGGEAGEDERQLREQESEPTRRWGRKHSWSRRSASCLSCPLPCSGWFMFSGAASHAHVVSTSVSLQDLCWARGHLRAHPVPGPGFRSRQSHGGICPHHFLPGSEWAFFFSMGLSVTGVRQAFEKPSLEAN